MPSYWGAGGAGADVAPDQQASVVSSDWWIDLLAYPGRVCVWCDIQDVTGMAEYGIH